MSVFKKNFLPSQSQPWARQVQDKLTDVEARFKTEIINNRTRDEQLQSSYNRLDKAVQDVIVTANTASAAANTANGIINNIYTPDTTTIAGGKITNGTISIGKLVAGTITGDVINGGTITGVTIQSAASGQRAVINSNEIDFYNSSEELTGNLSGGFFGGQKSLQISSEDGYVAIVNGSAPTDLGGSGDSTKFTVLVGDTRVSSGDFLVADNNSQFNRNVTVGAFSGDTPVGDLFLIKAQAVPTDNAANLHIFSSGRVARTTDTSSSLAKENVRPLDFDSSSFIAISPVRFDYKKGILSDEETSRFNKVGFIAEDFIDAGIGEDVIIPKEGENGYIGLRYDKLYMFLHKVVQEQNETIKELTARIEALESR